MRSNERTNRVNSADSLPDCVDIADDQREEIIDAFLLVSVPRQKFFTLEVVAGRDALGD
ncbi:hypothetical protein [Halorussus amylolyticus]|uniref:hypothetical protein n=1 Tax=Halorussus amylolyticus TaxID=1126242 RepID=UPI00192F85A9|nr:hypothetical protein [Halorussus amylolyticus]